MADSDFDGLQAFVDKQNGVPAPVVPPPAPAAAPVEPVAAAPTAPATPKAPDVPRGTEPAKEPVAAPTATERKKYRLPLKVAGEEQFEEFDEDDLDPTKGTEGYKRLTDSFQKARDYDRPGGALDKKAAKLAEERATAWMVQQGWLIAGTDGKLVENPLVSGYRDYVAAKAKGVQPAAATPQAVTPPAPELTQRQKRMAELRAQAGKPKAEGGGLDVMEILEYQDLAASEAAEETVTRRETAREKAQREAQERATAEATQRQTVQSKQDAAAQYNQRFWENHIEQAVQANKEKFRDPHTGLIDEQEVALAKDAMSNEIRRTDGDEAASRAYFDKIAAGRAARYQAEASRLPKVATAPPPPPAHRGGQPDTGGAQGEGFDPENPFPEGALGRFAARRAG